MVYMLLLEKMEKIFNYLSNIRKDLLLHFIVGLILTQVTGDIVYICTHSFYGGAITALIMGFVAGIAKEIYDYYHINHTSDIKDIIATILGSIVGALLVIIVLI